MRILLATGIFPPDIGGPSRMLAAMARSLKEAGFEVKILTYANENNHTDGLYRVSRKQSSALMYARYFWRMLVLSRWAEVVYVTDVYSVGYFAYLIKKLTGRKYIVRFAGDSAWEIASAKGWTSDYITDFQENTYDRKIEKLKSRRKKILSSADGIIAVSRFLGGLVERIGAKKERIQVIYNAVNFEDVGRGGKIGLRERFVPGAKIMVYSGRLVPWKGVEALIRIMSELIARFPSVHFLILGDGQEEASLKNLTRQLGLDAHVHFEGKVDQAKIIDYLSEADVFVLNTNYEGLSHAILDAMEAGIPVVSTRVGGNPELIEDGKEGLLVSYNDEHGLKESIGKILSDEAFARSLVANANAKLKQFDWDRAVRETIRFIKQITYGERSPD